MCHINSTVRGKRKSLHYFGGWLCKVDKYFGTSKKKKVNKQIEREGVHTLKWVNVEIDIICKLYFFLYIVYMLKTWWSKSVIDKYCCHAVWNLIFRVSIPYIWYIDIFLKNNCLTLMSLSSFSILNTWLFFLRWGSALTINLVLWLVSVGIIRIGHWGKIYNSSFH